MALTRREISAAIVLVCVVLAFNVNAAETNDADALRGVTVGKGVFLVDLDDPNKLALYLKVIQGTHQGLRRQGVAPDFVLVFIGPTVHFLTTDRGEVHDAQASLLDSIAQSVRELKELGVKLEVCDVALAVFKVDRETVLPETKVVGDGFISVIGYQTQGYHFVPVF